MRIRPNNIIFFLLLIATIMLLAACGNHAKRSAGTTLDDQTQQDPELQWMIRKKIPWILSYGNLPNLENPSGKAHGVTDGLAGILSVLP